MLLVITFALTACQGSSPAPSASTPSSVQASASPAETGLELPAGRIAYDRLRGEFGYEQPYEGTFVASGTSTKEQPVEVETQGEGIAPTWSPDGSKLLVNIWTPDIPGRPGIVDPDGSHLVILEPEGLTGFLWCTGWSPDQTSLVCSVDNDADPASEGIYTVGVDGQNLTQVTVSPNPSVEGTVSACGGNDIAPAYSPDGSRIAFLRAKCGPGEDPSGGQTATIAVVNVDGTHLVEITQPGLANSHGYSRVRWSPVDDRLVFGTEDGALYLVNPDGSEPTEIDLDIDASQVFAYTPDWSPDGTLIVFSLWVPGSTDLFVARPDGSDVTQITDRSFAEVWASWAGGP